MTASRILAFFSVLLLAMPAFADNYRHHQHDRPSSWVQFRDAAERQLARELVHGMFRPRPQVMYITPMTVQPMVVAPAMATAAHPAAVSSAPQPITMVVPVPAREAPVLVGYDNGRGGVRWVLTCSTGVRNLPPARDGWCYPRR